jgi:transposase InsO family protein
MPWQHLDLMSQRTEFALRALQTDNFRALCREYGISPRVGYKWKNRLLEEGMGRMEEHSRRPKTSPQELNEDIVCEMVKLRMKHMHWGARKLQEIYRRRHGRAPSESSFKRVFEKTGLVEKRRKRRASLGGSIGDTRKAQSSNEVWTIDFKGWWHDAQGRCEPLTVRDEWSRYLLEVRALENARTETVRSCFERLFEHYGLPQAIRSDNGVPFSSSSSIMGLSKLSAWWVALGIDLLRGRPAHPQDNGGHERMHKDIARELEGTSYPDRQAALDVWRREFNEERPHESLGMRMPKEVYQLSKRKWEGTPDQLDYEGLITRRVQKNGEIRFENQSIFLSTAIHAWDVGLKSLKNGPLEVYFAKLLLGYLNPETASFTPILPITAETIKEAA